MTRGWRAARIVTLGSIVLAAATALVIACGDDGTAASSGDDGGATPDGAAGDAGSEAACVRVAEDCTNGLDDDCNGLVDCQDPACTSAGFACAPSVPSGWRAVAFSPGERAVCPPHYSSGSTDVVDNLDAGAFGCACNCTGSTSCGGTVSISRYGQLNCGSVLTPITRTFEAGACLGNGQSLGAVSLSLAPQAPRLGTCQSSPAPLAAPQVTFDAGRICETAAAPGAGCSDGVCAPPSGGGFGRCITQAGDQACPAGFANKTLVAASAVDGRKCGACACNASLSCDVASVQFYANFDCTSQIEHASAACSSAVVSAPGSYDVTVDASGDAACGETAPSLVDGSADLDPSTRATVCCP